MIYWIVYAVIAAAMLAAILCFALDRHDFSGDNVVMAAIVSALWPVTAVVILLELFFKKISDGQNED